MYADVILSPGEFARYELAGKLAIVIDVFRFTTTILTALEAGLERFYPVADIDEAMEMQRAHQLSLGRGTKGATDPRF